MWENQALQLDPAQKSELTNDAATIAKMNKDIREFTDNDNGIAQITKNGIKNFSRNPREANGSLIHSAFTTFFDRL